MKDSVPAPNLRFPLPSLTYLHMEIGEGLLRWGWYAGGDKTGWFAVGENFNLPWLRA